MHCNERSSDTLISIFLPANLREKNEKKFTEFSDFNDITLSKSECASGVDTSQLHNSYCDANEMPSVSFSNYNLEEVRAETNSV